MLYLMFCLLAKSFKNFDNSSLSKSPLCSNFLSNSSVTSMSFCFSVTDFGRVHRNAMSLVNKSDNFLIRFDDQCNTERMCFSSNCKSALKCLKDQLKFKIEMKIIFEITPLRFHITI